LTPYGEGDISDLTYDDGAGNQIKTPIPKNGEKRNIGRIGKWKTGSLVRVSGIKLRGFLLLMVTVAVSEQKRNKENARKTGKNHRMK